MSVPDIFNYAVRLYRKRFWLLVALVMWLNVPLALIYNLLNIYYLGAGYTGIDSSISFEQDFRFILIGNLITILYSVAVVSLRPLADGAVVFAASRIMEDREDELSFSTAMGALFANKNWLKLLGAGLLVGLIVSVTFLPFFLPAAFFSIVFVFIAQAVLLESKEIKEALTRSWNLVINDFGRVFLVYFFVHVLSGILAVVVTFPVTSGALILPLMGNENFILAAALQVVSAFLGALVMPLPSIVVTVMYYELRCRREGLDIENELKLLNEQEYS